MCLTAAVEAKLYQTSPTQVNHDALNKIANDLIAMYKENEFTRESIQQVLAKLLRNINPLNPGAKVLERIVSEILGKDDFKTFIFKHSDNLSLFLTMRGVYMERFQGSLKEFDNVYRFEVVSGEKSY